MPPRFSRRYSKSPRHNIPPLSSRWQLQSCAALLLYSLFPEDKELPVYAPEEFYDTISRIGRLNTYWWRGVQLKAYRISKALYVRTAFDGVGSKQAGGRWYSPGRPVMDVGEQRATAAWEILVYVKRAQLLRDAYVIFEVTIPDALSQKSIEPNSDSMVGNYLISSFLTLFRTSADADIPATGRSLSSFLAMVNRL